ncbi:MAG: DUF4265 domain-containing protein [Planctomycetes bacterium]|nr:DUF4265 domain-containing protein [Planctomycetota bacterium]
MITVRHLHPACEPKIRRIVRVDLTPNGMPGKTEELCCDEVAPGKYVVCCLPFFAYGIAFGDLISAPAENLQFASVLRHSGLRTLRACFVEHSLAATLHEPVHAILSSLRHPHEWHGNGYFAVLLPDQQAEEETLKALAEFVENGILTHEVEPDSTADHSGDPAGLTV